MGIVRVPPYFDGPAIVEAWRDQWVVRAPVTYYRPTGHVTVPEGFLTDFASIPSLLWPAIHPTDPRILLPSLVHDRLYESHEVSRADADAMMWEAMGLTNASRILRWHVWAAVRAFGSMSYSTGQARQTIRRSEYQREVEA